MTAISRKEKAIATVVASSHRDVLTERELLSSQLKSRRPQLLPRRPIFWCCDAWMDETSHASDLKKLLQCLLQRWEEPRRRSWQAHKNIAISAQQESVQSGIWIYFQFRNRKGGNEIVQRKWLFPQQTYQPRSSLLASTWNECEDNCSLQK